MNMKQQGQSKKGKKKKRTSCERTIFAKLQSKDNQINQQQS